MLVETSRAATATPATTAPLLSVTVPRSVDKPCCPNKCEHKSSKDATPKPPKLIARVAGAIRTGIRGMKPPLAAEPSPESVSQTSNYRWKQIREAAQSPGISLIATV